MLVALTLLACVPASGPSVDNFTGTAGSATLKRDITATVMQSDQTRAIECEQRSIREIRPIDLNTQPDEKVTSIGVRGVEHWVLDRCGTTASYIILFVPDPGGGTVFSVVLDTADTRSKLGLQIDLPAP